MRVAQANLAASRARIGRLDVRAPTAGLVLSRSVEAGQVVSAGSPALFRIAAGGQMELRARLPQTELARLSIGVPATVTPVGSAQSYQGTVWQISPIIDPANRQGEARILVPYNRELRPGGFASVQINAGSTSAPLLPESAVLTDDTGTYVMIIGANNTVRAAHRPRRQRHGSAASSSPRASAATSGSSNRPAPSSTPASGFGPNGGRPAARR